MQGFGLSKEVITKIIESYETFIKAYKKLEEFIKTDNHSEKDRVAILHAFL